MEHFPREARAVSALSHIAMEFLDGTTLKHRMLARPLDREELLDIAMQVADAKG